MTETILIRTTGFELTSARRQAVDEGLGDLNADIVYTDVESSTDLITEHAGQAITGIVHPPNPTDASLFESFDSLQAVAVPGVGVDYIDLDAAAEFDVKVLNVPSHGDEEVSTHALALLLASVRRIPTWDRTVKSGEWDREAGRPLHRLAGRTLGFVAFGSIARRLAEKVRGFDLELLVFDPYLSQEDLEDHQAELVEFEALLTSSDVISIHAPLTDQTHHLFDEAAFDAMKDSAVVVNTGRGRIIDEEALYGALESGDIRGAALDVLEEEPVHASPLFDLDNVVFSPHVAGYSEESGVETFGLAVEYLASAIRGEAPPGLVTGSF